MELLWYLPSSIMQVFSISNTLKVPEANPAEKVIDLGLAAIQVQ